MIFGLLSGSVLVLDTMLSVVALAQRDFLSAGIGFAALATFGIVAGWLMIRSEKQVNRHLRDRSVGTLSSPIKLMIAAPVTQVVHLLALVRAYVLTDVTWRGIHYEIRSGMDVTRTNYSPYQTECCQKDSQTAAVHSL